MREKPKISKPAKVEPTLPEQVTSLTKQVRSLMRKVNQLTKENKAVLQERQDLTKSLSVSSHFQSEYHSMNTWMKMIYDHGREQDAAILDLQHALNRAKERSLTKLKPYRSALGKLVDDGGAVPVDGNALAILSAPKD